MSWAASHSLTKAAPVLPAGCITIFSGLAQANDQAKALLARLFAAMVSFLTTPLGLAVSAGTIIIWLVALWLTGWMASKEQNAIRSIAALGDRAADVSQGIVRLAALHRHRQDLAMQHAWANNADRNVFTSSSSLMGDFSVLYQAQAIAIFRQAQERNLPIGQHSLSSAEHPTNPLGVEEVGRELGVLANRIKTDG